MTKINVFKFFYLGKGCLELGLFFFSALFLLLLGLGRLGGDDVVDPHDHYCGLSGALQYLLLYHGRLCDAYLVHVLDLASIGVDACPLFSLCVSRLELCEDGDGVFSGVLYKYAYKVLKGVSVLVDG